LCESFRGSTAVSLRETIALGLGAIGILLLYVSAAGYQVDMVDEGYFVDLAHRV
jgi:hypothetical protein